jgi:hypothetical protein
MDIIILHLILKTNLKIRYFVEIATWILAEVMSLYKSPKSSLPDYLLVIQKIK